MTRDEIIAWCDESMRRTAEDKGCVLTRNQRSHSAMTRLVKPALVTSAAGRKFIEGWEKLFTHAYDDATERIVPAGHKAIGTLTIGYGHTTAAGPPRVYPGMKITATDADAVLSADLAHVEAEVNRVVKVSLTQPQYDSLVSFEFNTGWLAHPNCSLLKALNAGNYKLADNDFGLYDEASGKVLRGLVRRRDAEAKLFNEGVYSTQ